MGFDVRQLPPNMQKQALAKMLNQNVTQPKYHNIPTESNGIKFDSKKESKRYEELMLMQKADMIKDLKLQVNFTLQEGYTTTSGERIKPIIYKADFTYIKSDRLIVEDVKSEATKTKTYLMKKKMLQNKFGITILEV